MLGSETCCYGTLDNLVLLALYCLYEVQVSGRHFVVHCHTSGACCGTCHHGDDVRPETFDNTSHNTVQNTTCKL